jgi:spore germination protein YaaH
MKKIILIIFITLNFFPNITLAKNTENIFYYFPNTNGYRDVALNHKKIDILAPQIYTVGYDLKLGPAEDERILKLSKDQKIDVMPLVVQWGFDKSVMTRLLENTAVQDDLINNLVTEAKKRKFIGWQFDFENINHLDRNKYTDFIKRSSQEFKKKGLILSVAVIPRTSDYDKFAATQDWSSGYNIGDVSKYTDFITIMSYDDPKSQGPVASLDYVKETLEHTLKTTSAEKISLGVPLYCWQWEIGNPKKIANISYNKALETQEKYKDSGVFSLYITDYGVEVFVFIKDRKKINLAWCDNYQSLKAKKEIIERKGLRGISAWAVGQEDPRIWRHL